MVIWPCPTVDVLYNRMISLVQCRPQRKFVVLSFSLAYKRPFGDLIGSDSILRGNSVLRGKRPQHVTNLRETTLFTNFSRDLLHISGIRRITSHFIFEAAVTLQLRPIFPLNKPSLFSH